MIENEKFNVMDSLTEEVQANRISEYGVSPLILNRWSPRSFTEKPVPDEILYKILEAAGWAPSANNNQPWRFYVAKTDETRAKFNTFVNESNRSWCDRASILLLIGSSKITSDGKPHGPHAFDAGAAWGLLALQATVLGLHTHAMGGFDRDKARTTLNVPDEIDLHAVVAIGYKGDPDVLTEGQRQREKPSGRRPLKDSIMLE